MKSSTLKNIVVQCVARDSLFWKDEIKIDPDIFDDPLVEAATRAVEKRKNDPNFQVTVVIECFEKKHANIPSKHFCYNTYKVFINAGLYDKAEILRLNFKKEFGTDLREESLRGEKDNGDTNNSKPELN